MPSSCAACSAGSGGSGGSAGSAGSAVQAAQANDNSLSFLTALNCSSRFLFSFEKGRAQLAELEVVGEEEGGEGVDGAEHAELGPVGHAHAEGDQRLQGIRHLAREAEARLAASNFAAGTRNDPKYRLAMKKANISKTATTERSSR